MVTKRPTMAEIAREANVAISTVSKVLNGHTDVSLTTRKHIEQLLADRGYQRPRASRRPGRRSASHTGTGRLVIRRIAPPTPTPATGMLSASTTP